jgi:hypothetical protein
MHKVHKLSISLLNWISADQVIPCQKPLEYDLLLEFVKHFCLVEILIHC